MEERSSQKFTNIICATATASFLLATTLLHVIVVVYKHYSEATVVTLGTFLAAYIIVAMWLLLYYYQKNFWLHVKFICLIPICSHILSTFLASVIAYIEYEYEILVIPLCVLSWISLFVVFFAIAFALNQLLPFASDNEPIVQV